MTHIPAAPAAVDYLLLTPGPLSTTATVRAAMLQDSCTWDADYNLGVVEPIRRELVRLAAGPEYQNDYSAVLLQGSGSYVVESVLGSAIGVDERLLIINNGAYGARMIVAKNHSKVTLACNTKESYYITIESSANVNTNPRIEQSAIHCGKDLHAFYLEFFGGIKSIDKASTAH